MNILLIEGNPMNLFVLKKYLESMNFNVFYTQTTVEAIEILQNISNFHIILTDLFLPEMDGISLVEYVRKHSKFDQIPVIALTSANEFQLKKYNLSLFDKIFFKKNTLMDLKDEIFSSLKVKSISA